MDLTTRLNTDCLEKIFGYLRPRDLLNTGKVCKRWNESSKKVQNRWIILLNLKAEKMFSSPSYQEFQMRRSYVLTHLQNPTTKEAKIIYEGLTILNSITLSPSILHEHLSKIEALKDLKISDALLEEEKKAFGTPLRNLENMHLISDPTTRISKADLDFNIFYTYIGLMSIQELEFIISKEGVNVNSMIRFKEHHFDLISIILPLKHLKNEYKFDFINLLLKKGINRHSDAILSPLRLARENVNILRLLLENGYDAKTTDFKGNMLNDLDSLSVEAAQLLIKYGADPFSSSANRKSPIEEARFKKKTALVELFASTRQMDSKEFSIENLTQSINHIIHSVLYQQPKPLVDS